MTRAVTPAALAATHAAAFSAGEAWSEEAIVGALAGPGAVLVGDARAFLIGRIVADEAEILTLATHPDNRRTGLARAVLGQFESLAAEAGAAVIFLEVDAGNTPARALYAAAGYLQSGLRRGYYRRADGQRSDALVLEKRCFRDQRGPGRQDSC